MSQSDTAFALEQLLSVVPHAGSNHPPLSRDDMRDVLATALRAGQLMVENGANTSRVEETVHRLATALGADRMVRCVCDTDRNHCHGLSPRRTSHAHPANYPLGRRP